jgi:hypothetical protein
MSDTPPNYWPFSDSIPPGSKVIIDHQRRSETVRTPVCIERSGKLGFSDSKFMAVLSLLQRDPISDKPIVCGNRAWWWFDDDSELRKIVSAYYANWNGKVAHLSFVRACYELAYHFSTAAKEAKSEVLFGKPATLRRLDGVPR